MEVTNEQILKALVAIQTKQENIDASLNRIIDRLDKFHELTDKTGDFLGEKLDEVADALKGRY